MEEKVKKWNSAFMWLLLRKYYPRYVKEGLIEPDEVKEKSNKYIKDCDKYCEFLLGTYEVTKKTVDQISLASVYNEFKNWCREAYTGEKVPARKELINYLEN